MAIINDPNVKGAKVGEKNTTFNKTGIMYNPSASIPVIPAEAATSTISPLVIPPAPINPAPNAVIATAPGAVEVNPDGTPVEQAKETANQIVGDSSEEKAQDTQYQNTIGSLIEELSGKGAQVNQAQDAMGIATYQKELNDIRMEAARENVAQRARDLAIRSQPGIARPFVIDQAQAAADASARRLADFRIIESAALQNVDSIKQAAKDRIDLEFAGKELKLDYYKDLQKQNKDKINSDDAKRFQVALSDYERKMDAKKEEAKTLQDTKLQLLLAARQEGAPPGVLKTIQEAETPEDAVIAGGKYVDLLKRQATLAAINASRLSAQKLELEIEAQKNDVKNGVLTEAQIKAIDNSPQGKKVSTLGSLKQKVTNYKNLVSLYGTASFGAQKSTLDAAYADLKLAYKDAAELGALQGPDIALLEEALRPATSGNFITQAFRKTTGNGIDSIAAGLDQVIGIVEESAGTNITQLYARNPDYKNSDYVSTLISPLVTEIVDVSNIDSARINQVIKMPDGKLLQKQPDGSFKEIN